MDAFPSHIKSIYINTQNMFYAWSRVKNVNSYRKILTNILLFCEKM